MSVHFPIFKFSIIYLYIILNLSPMQVMFDLKSYEEPRWRKKKRNKQKITDFFSHSIYIVINSWTPPRQRGKRNNIKLKYRFPKKWFANYLKMLYIHIFKKKFLYKKNLLAVKAASFHSPLFDRRSMPRSMYILLELDFQ